MSYRTYLFDSCNGIGSTQIGRTSAKMRKPCKRLSQNFFKALASLLAPSSTWKTPSESNSPSK